MNPPLLPGERQVDFLGVFEAYEFSAANGRPKSGPEYVLVYQATMITWELMRLDRMKSKVLACQNRPAAEAVYRRTFDDLSTEGDSEDIRTSGVGAILLIRNTARPTRRSSRLLVTALERLRPKASFAPCRP